MEVGTAFRAAVGEGILDAEGMRDCRRVVAWGELVSVAGVGLERMVAERSSVKVCPVTSRVSDCLKSLTDPLPDGTANSPLERPVWETALRPTCKRSGPPS